MNKLLLAPWCIVLLLLSCSWTLVADIPPPPSPPRLVNDLADILTDRQEKELEYKLRLFHRNTSTQIVVISVHSLYGYDRASFAFEIGHKWKVGQKEFDNGIVILVKPKYDETDKGQVYIAVGYGLEAAIPDGIAKRIVTNEMIPHFQINDYYTGIRNATEVLMDLASGEISVPKRQKKSKIKSLFFIFLPFFLLFLLMMFWIWGRKSPFSIGSKNSFWKNLWLLNNTGGGYSGSWDNFTGGGSGYGGGNFQVGGHFGGGGSGSSSGIGFSGFGGGSFGGGGAGGSW